MKRIYTDIHIYTDDKFKIVHAEAFLNFSKEIHL